MEKPPILLPRSVDDALDQRHAARTLEDHAYARMCRRPGVVNTRLFARQGSWASRLCRLIAERVAE